MGGGTGMAKLADQSSRHTGGDATSDHPLAANGGASTPAGYPLPVSTWDLIAGSPLRIEGYSFQRLAQQVSSGFERVTTVVRLFGDGEQGVGEDVTYTPDDHAALLAWGTRLPLAGKHTLASLAEKLDELELFPSPPALVAARHYRRWAFESAALDLALRQQGRALHEALCRRPQPVRFVVSRRLAEPPRAAEIAALLAAAPGLRFKLDPTTAWDDGLCRDLAALGVVDCIDLKGAYQGTVVDLAPDPVLYGRVAAAFPAAWIEDPAVTAETRPVLEPHAGRITWDAVIHSTADIDVLPWRPQALNCKPSRFGSLRALLDFYDRCAADGIALYGGGQFELGPGRGQIQYLASLFHSDGCNDVAPVGWNAAEPAAGLPVSPLAPEPQSAGFRWGRDAR